MTGKGEFLQSDGDSLALNQGTGKWSTMENIDCGMVWKIGFDLCGRWTAPIFFRKYRWEIGETRNAELAISQRPVPRNLENCDPSGNGFFAWFDFWEIIGLIPDVKQDPKLPFKCYLNDFDQGLNRHLFWFGSRWIPIPSTRLSMSESRFIASKRTLHQITRIKHDIFLRFSVRRNLQIIVSELNNWIGP